MDSRRLVVWIAAGILGFQGGTLVLDLLNCSVLPWLYVRRHGLELSSPAPAPAQKQPVGEPLPTAADIGPEAAPAVPLSVPEPQDRTAQVPNTSSAASPPIPSASTPFDPTGVFCDRPRSRIDDPSARG
jgi:hypothetical protein